jgi:chitinase
MRGCFLFVLIGLLHLWPGALRAQKKDLTVTAYYAGDTVQMEQFDPLKLTHVVFSFCHLGGNRMVVRNGTDTLRIQNLVALKESNPVLKVLLSLGGWGGCENCSAVFSTDSGRREFASSVKELNTFFHTDGIDLDWEYPTIEGYPGHLYGPQDKKNFTALLVALRDSLGRKAEISFAAGGFQKYIDEAVEWGRVMPLVNRINLMSYDLVSGFATTTGHHTPLRSTPQQKESTDNAVTALIKKGVPPSKIVIGAAFYGRIWEAVSPTNNGLYQAGKFKKSVRFKYIEDSLSEAQGFVKYWDEVAEAPYLYNKDSAWFVTYDDKQSLTQKIKYIRQKGLNGVMFWELSYDVAADGLLDAIDKAKKAKGQQAPIKKHKVS